MLISVWYKRGQCSNVLSCWPSSNWTVAELALDWAGVLTANSAYKSSGDSSRKICSLRLGGGICRGSLFQMLRCSAVVKLGVSACSGSRRS